MNKPVILHGVTAHFTHPAEAEPLAIEFYVQKLGMCRPALEIKAQQVLESINAVVPVDHPISEVTLASVSYNGEVSFAVLE